MPSVNRPTSSRGGGVPGRLRAGCRQVSLGWGPPSRPPGAAPPTPLSLSAATGAVRRPSARPRPPSPSCTCSTAGAAGPSETPGSADEARPQPSYPRGCGCARRPARPGRDGAQRNAPRGPGRSPSRGRRRNAGRRVRRTPPREPGSQCGAVVVAVHPDEPAAVALQQVEGRGVDPVTGVEHDVGAREFGEELRGEFLRALGEVGVGHEQQAHGLRVGVRPSLRRGAWSRTRSTAQTVQLRLDSLPWRVLRWRHGT